MLKGSAKQFDHNQIVHDIWSMALVGKVALWIERVPSKFNIADSPSRHEWGILHDLGMGFSLRSYSTVCDFFMSRCMVD